MPERGDGGQPDSAEQGSGAVPGPAAAGRPRPGSRSGGSRPPAGGRDVWAAVVDGAADGGAAGTGPVAGGPAAESAGPGEARDAAGAQTAPKAEERWQQAVSPAAARPAAPRAPKAGATGAGTPRPEPGARSRKPGAPGGDLLSDLQRWLIRSSAKNVRREIEGQVRRTLGGARSDNPADVWRTATTEPPPDLAESPECAWCPICRAARKMRVSGPGLGAQISGAGGAVAMTVQEAVAALDAALARSKAESARRPGDRSGPARPRPEAARPEDARRETIRPDDPAREPAQPRPEPDTAQQDTAEPGTAQPGTAQPGTAQPGSARPEEAQSGTAQSAAAGPPAGDATAQVRRDEGPGHEPDDRD